MRTQVCGVALASVFSCALLSSSAYSANLLAGELLTSEVATIKDWDESATRLLYNSNTRLPWNREMGDYEAAPLASGTAVTGTTELRFTATGNSFALVCGAGATTTFGNRENDLAALRPTLIAGGRTYEATRDVLLHSSTYKSLGTAKTSNCSAGATMYVAFDGYSPRPGESAVLVLPVSRARGTQAFSLHRPVVRALSVEVPAVVDGTIVREITGKDFRIDKSMSLENGIVTGRLGGSELSPISEVFSLPPAREYYATVVMKVGHDWPNHGGKFPGLSNTGLGRGTTPTICHSAGWGGRRANGCRWSARTGWSQRNGDAVGIGTYHYSADNRSYSGAHDPFPVVAPTGKWFAYVQRVRVNDVGEANGQLSYWWCTEQGCAPIYHKADIRWRDLDAPDALITEMWGDIFCGGTDCGAPLGQAPASTTSIKRLTVTRGLPSFTSISAELRALNR